MKQFYKKWNRKEEVPSLILSWAEYIGGNEITIEDVNCLNLEYQNYASKLDDIVQHDSTIAQ